MTPTLIRMREVGRTKVWRKRLYELELTEASGVVTLTRTPAPVTMIDRYIGVQEAWALIHGASTDADTGQTGWVTFRCE